MKHARRWIRLSLLAFLCLPASLFADYTLVLKNGRRITVESYREEDGMIKFRGLGGEIGIAKDQVQAISTPGQNETRGLIVPKSGDFPSGGGPGQSPANSANEKTQQETKNPAETRLSLDEQRAREEGAYQAKLNNITGELQALKTRYVIATRGIDSPNDTLTSQKAMESWAAELSSEIKDSEKRPTSEYSPKERELSELRSRIDQLQKEREKLTQEMRERGFESSPSR